MENLLDISIIDRVSNEALQSKTHFPYIREWIADLSEVQICLFDIELQVIQVSTGVSKKEHRKNIRILRPDVELPSLNDK